MSGAGAPHGKVRRRDGWLSGKFKQFRSPSPATQVSQSGTTRPNVHSPSNSASQISSSVAQPSSVSPSSSTVRLLTSSSSPSHDFLAAAFQHLSPRELKTLQPCILSANDDINDVLKQSVAKVKEKQAECEAKRWTFEFAGRSTVLREEADKVVKWLNRFKSVGDIATNADPVHAGLAWAGVRLLLQVIVSEANVMASLLIGCQTVLYMTSRLDAYLDFWHSLSDSHSPKPHLKDAMAEMYGCVLGFLAQAIETFQQSGFKRAFNSLWHESDVQNFEGRCNNHADRVEKQAIACNRVLREKDSTAVTQSYQDLQQVLQELQQIRSVQLVVDRIERKIDLQGLKIVQEAMFDAQQKHTGCHPSTREALLQQIRDWARRPDSKAIFWLQGMAGTGKSTISWTTADWLCSHAPKDEVELGATFFFERRENDRASAQFLFPTIIHQLAQKIPGLDVLVAQAVGQNPDISFKNPAEKFEILMRQPLQQLAPTLSQPVYVVVVDALDECKTDEIAQVQRLLSELPTFRNIRLRLFLTSRPEVPIQQSFQGLSPDVRKVVLLDEVPRPIIQQDILSYLRVAFITIRTGFNSLPLLDEPLPECWPGEEVLRELTDMAVPLFIVAATIHRFVFDFRPLRPDPRESLAIVLRSRKLGHMSPLMQVYLPVLGYLTPLSTDETDSIDNDELCKDFQMIVGSIITLAEPLSRKALAQLLNVSNTTIARHMRPLYSVLQIPSAADVPVRLLHLSFAEFLTSPKISNRPFAVNSMATHDMLFKKCIELLSRRGLQGLRENICHLRFPGQSRHDLSPVQVDEKLPPEMQYACRYWVYYAERSKHQIHDNGTVHTFLLQHFLHWLEALSLMGCLAIAIKNIGTLQLLATAVTCNKSTDVEPTSSSSRCEGSMHIRNLLEDARRFVLANRYICERAPLQLYSSCLIFAPWKSIVRQECGKMPVWVQRIPNTAEEWGPELQVLEGHARSVNAVAFSSDGALLASASDDLSVRLWDVSTGQEVQKLEGHTESVTGVVFASPDDSIVVSSSRDHTVRFWDVRTGDEMQKLEKLHEPVSTLVCSSDKALLACSCSKMTLVWETITGQEMHQLKGHSDDIRGLAFSSDGALLASGSWDETVRVWSLNTGQCVHKLQHNESVVSVAFSLNNVLASGSSDSTIRLWDAETGQGITELKGQKYWVTSLMFSQLNHTKLASAGFDHTVRTWDTDTGQEIQRLQGHTDGVRAVSYSPDGTMIASASSDDTVRLWSTSSDEETRQFSDSDSRIAGTVFSPNAALLAASYFDYTVRLFDVSTGDEVQVFKGHTDYVGDLSFSYDSALLATASADTTVRLWSTNTGQVLQIFQGHSDLVRRVTFLQGGTSLASTSDDGTVRIWSTSTGQEAQRFGGCIGSFHVVAFSSDEDLIASGAGDTIWLWSISTGQEVRTIERWTHEISALAISFSKALLASGSEDGTICLWDASTGQSICMLEGHTSMIRVLTFNHDDALLASSAAGVDEQTIRLWNTSTGQEVRKLELNVWIAELKFAPDKSTLITNLGCIQTGLAGDSNAGTISHPGVHGDIFVNEDWIQHLGRNLLWLPMYYRQWKTSVQGNIVAIGRSDGRIYILKINYP